MGDGCREGAACRSRTLQPQRRCAVALPGIQHPFLCRVMIHPTRAHTAPPRGVSAPNVSTNPRAVHVSKSSSWLKINKMDKLIQPQGGHSCYRRHIRTFLSTLRFTGKRFPHLPLITRVIAGGGRQGKFSSIMLQRSKKKEPALPP